MAFVRFLQASYWLLIITGHSLIILILPLVATVGGITWFQTSRFNLCISKLVLISLIKTIGGPSLREPEHHLNQ